MPWSLVCVLLSTRAATPFPYFFCVRLVLFYNQYSDYCSLDDLFYSALAFASVSIKFPSKVAVAVPVGVIVITVAMN
ncbi:uncharacterized protein DS421_4g113610 [Arachis hypogaea]|nr:uncharacterized protein DS421_4g113610 [Arachis hypogaea]